MASYDVVSVCNALMDILFNAKEEDLERFKFKPGTMHLVDAETQGQVLEHLSSKQIKEELGGSALNAMRALALLRHKVYFIGMVGNDEFGKKINSRLTELGIQGEMKVCSEDRTGVSMILVTPDGERTMITHLGASRNYTIEHIPVSQIENSRIFHFCGYQWDTSNQKEAIREAVSIARKCGTMVSFDLADPFVVQQHRAQFVELIQNGVDLVFANEAEAELLFDLDPEETAEMIAGYGAIAIIKLGAKGALIQKGKERFMIASVPTKVVDTTAAGDMFAAGFLHGFLADKSLRECGEAGARLAGDVISRYGATLSDEIILSFN